jgi:hypothetical protein
MLSWLALSPRQETSMAVCPHCDKPLSELTLNPMEGKVPIGLAFNCMLFSCPSCQKAIGASVDASSGQADLRNRLDELTRRVGQG